MGEAARRKQSRFGTRSPSLDSVPSLARRARVSALAGDSSGAMTLYAQALSRGNNAPEVSNDLGALLARSGQLPAAVVQFEMALALAPDAVEVRNNLLKALEAMSLTAFCESRWQDAAAGYRRLTVLDPACVVFQTNAGRALRELKLAEQALPYFRRAVELDSGNSNAHLNLGLVLLDLNQRESEVELERAIELDPTNASARVNLSTVLYRLGHLARAAEMARRTLEIFPNEGEGHATLGAVLREQGEIQASLEGYRRALQIRPESASVFSGYLLARQADPTAEPADLLADHRVWAARFATHLEPGPAVRWTVTDHDPRRRLRVGYVSADFRNHSVASFIEPVIRAHDANAVQVHCYSDATPDLVTARIRTQARPDVWRDVRTLTDEALARQIVEDRIDILVDLAGHTAGNRLLCFARRPAPVQVTYCGYPGTTGLSAIDWRLTDTISDPESVTDRNYVEQLWRLPNGFLCFQPNADVGVPDSPPSLKCGFVTFGSFNNLSKLGDAVLALWADILQSVPGSRLLLKARPLSDAQPRERLRRVFSDHDIDPARIEFVRYAATTAEHIAVYGQVDIGLDPFPYNGTTTTCEALWMGVPVITLLGRAHAGRVGASLLTRIGCSDLVAATRGDYVLTARRLAEDPGALMALRRDMRAKMSSSSLMNAGMITRDIEAAYREMWRRFCSGQRA